MGACGSGYETRKGRSSGSNDYFTPILNQSDATWQEFVLIVFIVCRSSVTHTMPFNGNGFFLAEDGASRRREGRSEIERPLARFVLERTREQKNLISQSARPGVDILSRFLNV